MQQTLPGLLRKSLNQPPQKVKIKCPNECLSIARLARLCLMNLRSSEFVQQVDEIYITNNLKSILFYTIKFTQILLEKGSIVKVL